MGWTWIVLGMLLFWGIVILGMAALVRALAPEQADREKRS